MRLRTTRSLIFLVALVVLGRTVPAMATELEVKEQAPAKTNKTKTKAGSAKQQAETKDVKQAETSAQQQPAAAQAANTSAAKPAGNAEPGVNTLEDIYAAAQVPPKSEAKKPASETEASTQVEWRSEETPKKP